MNEKSFERAVAAAFLGTWLANNYQDACNRGEHERLNRPPVEDAAFLAGKALEEWKKHIGAET